MAKKVTTKKAPKAKDWRQERLDQMVEGAQSAGWASAKLMIEFEPVELPNGFAYARVASNVIGLDSSKEPLACESMDRLLGETEKTKPGSKEHLRSAKRVMSGMRQDQAMREMGLGGFQGERSDGAMEKAERGLGRQFKAAPWVARWSASNLKFLAANLDSRLALLKKKEALGEVEISKEGEVYSSCQGALKGEMRPGQIVALGSMRLEGALWGLDPCYAGEGRFENLGAKVEGASGMYHGYLLRAGAGDWGDRCAELWVAREGVEIADVMLSSKAPWKEADESIGVDSGQAGLFQQEGYPEGERRDGAGEEFYNRACDGTLGDFGAAKIKEGFVSSSGDGDGGYGLRVLHDKKGLLLAARIEFYGRGADIRNAVGHALSRRQEKQLREAAREGSAPQRKMKL